MLKMARVNGSPSRNSRTGVLVDAVGDAVARAFPIESTTISLGQSSINFMCGLTRADITAQGEWLVSQVEAADILIIGTPVYRASCTGVFKHFFDLVDKDILRGRKAVLCATGGTAMHGLMLEHHLRSLMSFFSVHTMPTALFGLNEDFADGKIANPDLNVRIKRVVSELVDVMAENRVLIHA